MAGKGHMIGYAQMPSSSSYWWKISAGLIQGSMGLKKEVISGWEQAINCIENSCLVSIFPSSESILLFHVVKNSA